MGGVGFCCATASTVHAPMRPATMLPANARSLKVNKDIVVPPLAASAFPPPGQGHLVPSSYYGPGSGRHCTSNSMQVGAFKRSEHREKRHKDEVGATFVVAPVAGGRGAQTGRPQGSPLRQVILADLQSRGSAPQATGHPMPFAPPLECRRFAYSRKKLADPSPG